MSDGAHSVWGARQSMVRQRGVGTCHGCRDGRQGYSAVEVGAQPVRQQDHIAGVQHNSYCKMTLYERREQQLLNLSKHRAHQYTRMPRSKYECKPRQSCCQVHRSCTT